MGKYRNQPYGYIMRHGEMEAFPREADVVRNIFSEYLAGATYQAIADTLSEEGVPYSDTRNVWDKHLIKRILENRNYIGEKHYPGIVDEWVFHKAQELRRSKLCSSREPIPPAIAAIRERAFCGECRYPIKRHSESRKRMGVRWRCANGDCSADNRLGDEDVLAVTGKLLNRIRNVPPRK